MKSRILITPAVVLLFRIVLIILFCVYRCAFPYAVESYFLNFYEEFLWDIDRDCIEYIDCFWYDCYWYPIFPTDPDQVRSFHLLVTTFISFFNSLRFWLYKSSTSLVTVITIYFIFLRLQYHSFEFILSVFFICVY